MDSRSRVWVALTDDEIHIGILRGGCDGSKMKGWRKEQLAHFPWFLIPSICFF